MRKNNWILGRLGAIYKEIILSRTLGSSSKTTPEINSGATRESGRSMTEMLGVLAVIAVLTIGAIAGYSYAMNKHRANVILNDVKRIAVFVVSSNFMQKENGAIEDLDIEVESNTPYTVTKEAEKTFYIGAGDVSKKVCDILVKEKPAYAEDVRANAMTTKVCGEGKNEVFFYINTDMNGSDDSDKPQECSVTQPCSGCGACTAGRCVDKDANCPSGQYCVNGTCGCEKGQVTGTDGTCRPCDDMSVFTALATECSKCSDRIWYSLGYSRSQCAPCPSGSHPDLTRTKCVCGGDEFWNTGASSIGSHCSSCSLSNWEYPFTTLEECHKCPNRYSIFMQNGSLGISCADCNIYLAFSNVLKIDKSECDRCPNRIFVESNSTCLNCFGWGADQKTGRCQCPAGTIWNVDGYSKSNTCLSCESVFTGSTSVEECHSCPNRFIALQNACYNCKDSGGSQTFNSTITECNRCSQRYFDTSTSICKLCPTGQVKNADGTGCV